MDWDDKCYECGGYCDNYYYDEEKDEYVKSCDDCPYSEYSERWDDE